METLSTPKSIFLVTNCTRTINSTPHSPNHFPVPKKTQPSYSCQPNSIRTSKNHSLPHFKNPLLLLQTRPSQFLSFLKVNPHFYFLSVGFSFPLSSFASETSVLPIDQQLPNKINLEEILVSIDDFFNRYPFFVAGVSFIWLFVIPITQQFLRNYKYISAINAFKKLKDDPNAQLLDIRDRRSLRALGSPNLKVFSKKVVQTQFIEGDEEEFVKKVAEKFVDPANTIICILDNFDGDSLKVAELLVNNGFKEAYAISNGVRGKNGWLEIQEDLLPLSVHMYPPKKVRKSKQLEKNGAVNSQTQESNQSSALGTSKLVDNGHVNMSIEPTAVTKHISRSSSPYPKYPDMKPPSSPTPSKPHN